MRAEIKTLWVNALRSGEYEQARGALHRKGEGYCCLGVLCDLAYKAGVVGRSKGFGTRYVYGSADNGLPSEVREWAGLSGYDPVVKWRFESSMGDIEWGADVFGLSYLNDGFHLTFDEIAELIEEQL